MPFPTFDDEPPQLPVKKGPSLGKWMAIGIPGSILTCVLIGWLWLLPDLRKGDTSNMTATCISNLGEIARAVQMYEADHDDLIPDQKWNDKLMPYLRKVPDAVLIFSCPVQRRLDPETSGYALNKAIAGKAAKDVGPPEQTILVFDSKETDKSALAPTSDLASPGRHEHGRRDSVLYLSGAAKSIPAP
jgi:hypothetical protein